MNENERPGGWINGIGWVVRERQLSVGDVVADPDGGQWVASGSTCTLDDLAVVVGWADGTVPCVPVAPEVDERPRVWVDHEGDLIVGDRAGPTIGLRNGKTMTVFRDYGLTDEQAIAALTAHAASGVPSTPQAPDERTETLANALRLTVEYVGLDSLPPIAGWSWFDALRTEPWFDAWLDDMTNPRSPDPAPSTSDKEAPSEVES